MIIVKKKNNRNHAQPHEKCPEYYRHKNDMNYSIPNIFQFNLTVTIENTMRYYDIVHKIQVVLQS